MAKWRLVQVADEDAVPTDLTDDELVGISVLLTHHRSPRGDESVYWRARQKIRDAVAIALEA
jgi:hypothetical protein